MWLTFSSPGVEKTNECSGERMRNKIRSRRSGYSTRAALWWRRFTLSYLFQPELDPAREVVDRQIEEIL